MDRVAVVMGGVSDAELRRMVVCGFLPVAVMVLVPVMLVVAISPIGRSVQVPVIEVEAA